MGREWFKGAVYPYPGIGTIQLFASGERRYLVHDNPAPFSMGAVPPPRLTVVQPDSDPVPCTGATPDRRTGVVPLGKRNRKVVRVGRRRRRFFWVCVDDLVQEGCRLLEPGLYFDTPDAPGASPNGDVYGPFRSMEEALLAASLAFQEDGPPRRRGNASARSTTQGYSPPVWGDFERRFGKGPPADETCEVVGTIDLGGLVHSIWGCSDPQPLLRTGRTRPGVYAFPQLHTRRHWPGATASWYDAWYHEDGCFPGRRTFVVYQGGVTVRERRRRARECARARRPRPSTQ